MQALKNNTIELEGFDADDFEVVRQWIYNTYEFSLHKGTKDFKLPESPEISSIMRFFRVMQLADYFMMEYLVRALCDLLVDEIVESLSQFAGRRKYVSDRKNMGHVYDGAQMVEADKKKGVQALSQIQQDLLDTPPGNADHHQRLLDEHFEQISRLPVNLRHKLQHAVQIGILQNVGEEVNG